MHTIIHSLTISLFIFFTLPTYALELQTNDDLPHAAPHNHNHHLSRENIAESTAVPLAYENSALLSLLCNGDLAGAQLLINSNVDVNATNDTQENTLYLLMKQVRGKEPLDDPENPKSCTATPVIRMLLENKASVNAANYYENTPLLLAVDKACIAVVQLLLEHGAHTNTHNAQGITPLHSAAFGERWTTAELLLTYGADPLCSTDPHLKPLEKKQIKQLMAIQKKMAAQERDCKRLCEPYRKHRSCCIS